MATETADTALGRRRADPQFDVEHLASCLTRARTNKGLSRQQLQGISGVHNVTIAKIEAAIVPGVSVDTIWRLSKALGFGFEDVIRAKKGR